MSLQLTIWEMAQRAFPTDPKLAQALCEEMIDAAKRREIDATPIEEAEMPTFMAVVGRERGDRLPKPDRPKDIRYGSPAVVFSMLKWLATHEYPLPEGTRNTLNAEEREVVRAIVASKLKDAQQLKTRRTTDEHSGIKSATALGVVLRALTPHLPPKYKDDSGVINKAVADAMGQWLSNEDGAEPYGWKTKGLQDLISKSLKAADALQKSNQ